MLSANFESLKRCLQGTTFRRHNILRESLYTCVKRFILKITYVFTSKYLEKKLRNKHENVITYYSQTENVHNDDVVRRQNSNNIIIFRCVIIDYSTSYTSCLPESNIITKQILKLERDTSIII